MIKPFCSSHSPLKKKIGPQSPGTWQRQRGLVCLQLHLCLVLLLVELHSWGNLVTSMEVCEKPSFPWVPGDGHHVRPGIEGTPVGQPKSLPGLYSWYLPALSLAVPKEGKQSALRVTGQPSPPLVGNNSGVCPLPLRKGILVVPVICIGYRASGLWLQHPSLPGSFPNSHAAQSGGTCGPQ